MPANVLWLTVSFLNRKLIYKFWLCTCRTMTGMNSWASAVGPISGDLYSLTKTTNSTSNYVTLARLNSSGSVSYAVAFEWNPTYVELKLVQSETKVMFLCQKTTIDVIVLNSTDGSYISRLVSATIVKNVDSNIELSSDESTIYFGIQDANNLGNLCQLTLSTNFLDWAIDGLVLNPKGIRLITSDALFFNSVQRLSPNDFYMQRIK